MHASAQPGRARKRGVSLVEVMIAMVVLAVLALGIGSYLAMDQPALALQRNRRTALELANSRLEELRAVSFKALVAMLPPTNYSTFYFTRASATNWTNSATPVYETTNVNGVAAYLLTAVQLAGPTNYAALTVNVSFANTNDPNRQVTLQTYYFEP